MDMDRVKGARDQATGSVKEAIGKVTGDKRTEAEGRAQKIGGAARSEAGEAKDAVRDAPSKT